MKKKLLFILNTFLLINILKAQELPSPYSYSIPVNYITAWDVKIPLQNPADIVQTGKKADEILFSTQYFDGLGRPLQTVVKQGSQVTGGIATDLVSPVYYDQFGRESLHFLPFASNMADGQFKFDAFSQEKRFYDAQLAGQHETFYYGQTNFEASPLNRVEKQLAPGNNWVGNNKGVETKYLSNTAADAVRIWNVTDANNAGTFSSYSTSKVYDPGELHKTVTIDENGQQTIEFKDKQGLVILKKIQGNNDAWICTYYIYDDLNNLRCVIQPEGVKALTANNYKLTPTLLNEQCFRYEFDERNRMIMKKVPGAGEVYMVYDQRDRLVMTQDSNMRKDSKWLTTLYDVLNRPLLTGFIDYSGTFTSLQASVKAQTQTETPLQIQTGATSGSSNVAADLVLNTQGVTGDNQATSTIVLDDNFTSGDEFIAEIVSGTANGGGITTIINVNVSCNPLPPGTTFDVLTQTHYDDYSSLPTGLMASISPYTNEGFITSYNAAPDYAQEIKASDKTKSFVTWTRTRILGTDQYTANVNLYDDKGRVIQVQGSNATGGTDVMTTQYSWAGKPLRSLQKLDKQGANAQSMELLTTYNYDDLGRVASIKKKVSKAGLTDTETTIVQNEYDALGQLKKKKLAPEYSPAGGAGLESLTYDYNIRGWMLGANRDYATNTTSITHYFGYDLGYDKTETAIPQTTYLSPQLNGNIAGTIWKTKGSGELRKYDFAYDAVNRLTGADFNQYTSNGFNKNAKVDYSVSNLSYDDNGNIKTMNQMGLKGSGSTPVDQLSYEYIAGTNKLNKVTDTANDASSTLGDFKYSIKGIKDYDYDGNGNLRLDNNKNIQGITYNYLNLPQKITTDKGAVEYVYDAAGNKLKKIVTEGTITKTTLYLGGAVFQDDTLQFVAHEEGRIRITQNPQLTTQNFAFDYFLKDHLGNVRMVLTDEQKQEVYPPATLEGNINGTGIPNAIAVEKNFYDINTANVVDKSQATGITDYQNTNSIEYKNDYSNKTANSAKLYKLQATSSGGVTGLSFTAKVMSGDTINILGKSYYFQNNTQQNYSVPVASILTGLLSGGVAAGKAALADLSGNNAITQAITNGLTESGRSDNGTNQTPKAYINYMFFDEQFNVVKIGYSRVGNANAVKDHFSELQKLPVQKNGYLYVYVSNESPVAVFFDNLQVVHTRGPIIEENHYYPFGLTMAGISSRASEFGKPENHFKYNGKEEQRKEFSDGSGLEWLDFDNRFYDGQLGRFHIQDRMTDSFPSQSSYLYSRNNPMRYIDIKGDSAWPITKEWSDQMISDFRTFVSNRIQQAYKNKERYTCEDLALATVIDFASQNGLPLVIQNGTGNLSASGNTYDNADDFKCAALATTAASDLPNNTVPVDKNNVQPGDLLLHNENNPGITNHTQVVSSNTSRAIVIYQGNQGGGGADPCGFGSYCGQKTQQGYYSRATGDYSNTSLKTNKPGLLNRSFIHGARWNFKNWNGK